MNTNIESRRITFFLLFSFGIAWALALGIDLTGGLTNLTPGTITWLLMVLAMFSPALANVLTRWITKESVERNLFKSQPETEQTLFADRVVWHPGITASGHGDLFCVVPVLF